MDGAGRDEGGGPLSLGFHALCTLMLGSVSKCCLRLEEGEGWKRSPCGCVLDGAYGRAVCGGAAGFHPHQYWAFHCHLGFFPSPSPHFVSSVEPSSLIPDSFLSLTAPPLAGPNAVGCNPRGAPDTVNSPFTRAAELLQTFLLIFTGLKASPFSLIIP